MTKAEEEVLKAVAEHYAQDTYERHPSAFMRDVSDPARELLRERTHPEAIENVRQAVIREWDAERVRHELVQKLKVPTILLEGKDGLYSQWHAQWVAERDGRKP